MSEIIVFDKDDLATSIPNLGSTFCKIDRYKPSVC